MTTNILQFKSRPDWPHYAAFLGPGSELSGVGTSPEAAIADARERYDFVGECDDTFGACTERLYDAVRAGRMPAWRVDDAGIVDIDE